MGKLYYREQTLETIARKALCGFDESLYYGTPAAVPIEAIIEAHAPLVLDMNNIPDPGQVGADDVW